MTDEVYESLRTIVRNRPALAKEPEVDGYSGFLLIDKKQQPKVALHIENGLTRSASETGQKGSGKYAGYYANYYAKLA